MSRILYIAPVNVEGELLERELEVTARPGNQIDVIGFSRGRMPFARRPDPA